MPPLGRLLDRTVTTVEWARSADRPADLLQGVTSRLGGGPVADLLSGTGIGHPLHPALVARRVGLTHALGDAVGLSILTGSWPTRRAGRSGRLLALTGFGVRGLSGWLGGPLHEGRVVDGCVECPWHQGTVDRVDGSVRRGPATRPAPVFETRVIDDRIHLRHRGSAPMGDPGPRGLMVVLSDIVDHSGGSVVLVGVRAPGPS